MKNQANFLFYLWLAVSALAGLNILFFGILIISSATSLQVQYVPDDTFYYLLLAKNFSLLSQWTFDLGISVTSGFHVLWAYLLLALYKILGPDLDHFVNNALSLSLFCTVVMVFVWWLWSLRLKNVYFLTFFTLIISSRNFVYNSISGTEWALVVFISTCYGLFFFSRSDYNNKNLVILFLIGILGSLARSDFGLLPFSFFVAVGLYNFIRPKIMPLIFPFVGLLGSIVGVLLVFAHNYIFTSQFLQSSARMKGYWGQFEPSNYFVTPLFLGILVGTIGLFVLTFFVIAAILPKFIHKENQSNSSHNSAAEHTVLMILAATLCLVGYTLVYAHSSAVQRWYTANLIVPLLILVWAVSDYLKPSIRNKSIAWIGTLVVIPVLVLNILSIYPLNTKIAPWPHQQIMLEAGQYLSEHPVEGLVGAWNAGIIGYYSGGHVVNLDGLVNNDIYEYAVSNALPVYIREKNICHIIDFENMLTRESVRIRGGYNYPQWLAQNFEQTKVFDDGRFSWHYLTLYRLTSPNCLS